MKQEELLKILNEWKTEIEEKIEDYPRKITQKQYIKEYDRISKIKHLIK